MADQLPSWAQAGKRVHLVGIKGVAMTSLAQCLLDLGVQVSGSDVPAEFVTQNLLSKLSIHINNNFHADNINTLLDALVYTGAHQGRSNPEVQQAIRLGIPCFHHAQALGMLTSALTLTAVCGVGGKTTTSAMLAWILQTVQVNVGFSVGVGNIPNLQKTGQFLAETKLFVAEADEYACEPGFDSTSRFMFLDPTIIICTNMVFDHPDVFADFEETKRRYTAFFRKLQTKKESWLIVNGDDKPLRSLSSQVLKSKSHVWSVGHDVECAFQVLKFETSPGKTRTTFLDPERQEHILELCIPGEFNAQNALFALAAARLNGVKIEDSLIALRQFRGAMRRFEFLGKELGVAHYDDYAHHPAELAHTLSALRAWEPNKKIIAVFQPHTYSRTKALLSDFGEALTLADEVYVTDIYASAREAFDPSICSEDLVAKVNIAGGKATASGDLQATSKLLQVSLNQGTVLITLGAGDVYKIHQLLKP